MDRRRAAVHEAGHAVAADEFGFLNTVSIEPSSVRRALLQRGWPADAVKHGCEREERRGAGATTLTPTVDEQLARWPLRVLPGRFFVQREIRKFVVIELAGTVAEQLLLGNVNEAWASEDRRAARGLAIKGRVPTIYGDRGPALDLYNQQIETFLECQHRATQALVTRRRGDVARVVDALLERGRLETLVGVLDERR